MKKNERHNNRKFILLLILILLLSIISISIEYLKVSNTLDKNNDYSTIDSKTNSWDIEFTSSSFNCIGQAKVNNLKTSSSQITFNVTLNAPKDTITIYSKIENLGKIDATLDSFIKGTPKFKSTDFSLEQEEKLNNALSYNVTYADGSKIKLGDILKANESKIIKIVISLKENVSVNSSIYIENLNVIMLYKQI